MNAIVLPLNSPNPSLQDVGGKGQSLARLVAVGLPVPTGFLIRTDAYDRFVEVNNLHNTIRNCLGVAQSGGAEDFDNESAEIREAFEASEIPPELAEPILAAYAELNGTHPAVAVRSSATAEDRPDFSFAGQQDSYLNVRGDQEVLNSVRRCWASLWTARAIEYRRQMNVDQQNVSMGVVVQQMVAAETSGVLFTANPTTGDRTQLVINASFGLGEAIVSGTVTPDTYVLHRETLETERQVIGEKHEMIVPAADGHTSRVSVSDAKRSESSVHPALLRDLGELSLQVDRLFDDVPQDIEWAISEGQCYLLQARPITNLPPAPLQVTWDPPIKGTMLVRRQVVENMPDPLSPLFDDLYLSVALEDAVEQFLKDFGMEGLDFSSFIDRPMFLTVNGYAYCRGSYRMSMRTLRQLPKIIHLYFVAVPKLFRNIEGRWRNEALPSYLSTIDQWKSRDPKQGTPEELITGLRELAIADGNYWFAISIMVGIAKITDGLLNGFVGSRMVPGDLNSGMFLRGFPSKTIEGQVELEAIATRICADRGMRDRVCAATVDCLLETLHSEPADEVVANSIQSYLEQYGHQVYNLDFAEPTQIEDPSAILLGLKTLVERGDFDSRTRQDQLARERDVLVEDTLKQLGPIRRWLFRKILGWAQRFGPGREESLFYMGAAWSTLRQIALELGRRMVADGALRNPHDVFFLTMSELTEASTLDEKLPATLQTRVDDRRELRRQRKRLHPPGKIPEGKPWRIGPFNLRMWETQVRNSSDSDTLNGFAVSPGTITGVASVVLSADDFPDMKPDTILVCPTTTPAWTPLLAQASGLVTDIGGILAHGSIVAREYGIPAVLGTGNATRRIATGQRIKVDGIAGTVTLL